MKGELGVQKVYDLPVSLHTKEIFEKRVQEIRDNGGSMGYHARYTRVGEVKERVHQVSTFIMDGWAGTQRYAGVWSGDQTGGEWEYIRFHIPTYIGSGIRGTWL